MLVNKAYHQFLLKFFKDIDVYQHLQIIVLINRLGGKCTQKELCVQLYIEKSYMVKIIDTLEQKDYIIKVVNYKDRRSNLISLTPKALEIIETFNNHMENFTDTMGKHLTWQERHDCVRTLKLVTENFKELNVE